MSSPVYNPGQPFMLPIEGGFSPGKIAHITGTYSPNPTSVVLKIQTGPYGDPSDDIGLCLYGRFNEQIIGCNAFTRQSGWGQEEAQPSHHLSPGQQFDITILCDPGAFKIALNREHFTDFNHRLDPSRLTHLNVTSGSNDLQIGCIWIEGTAPVQYSSHSPTHYQGTPQQNTYGNNDYSHSSHKNKGLMGMVGSAGAAVAGALGASHLLGKSKGGYSSPSGYGGYPHSGGYPKSSHGGGGMVNKALGLGGGLLAAKTAKKGMGGLGGLGGLGGKNALKYGVPLAGAGLGGYMLTKGLSGSFDDDCCDWGSDSD